jgi:hypothetical protein
LTLTYSFGTFNGMAQDEEQEHPLKAWMLSHGYEKDYARVARLLPSGPTGESIRQVANGYRRPSWDLAFEIEVATGGEVNAHDLRDQRWYATAA